MQTDIDEAIKSFNIIREKAGVLSSLHPSHFDNVLSCLEKCKREEWQPIETAPQDGFYLVGCDDPIDDRPPFVISGEIHHMASDGVPSHLSSDYLTHWMPLPTHPKSDEESKK